MALDAATLALTANELAKTLADTRVDKIFEPTKDEVLIQLRAMRGGYRLFCSARSGAARIGLTDEKFENPQVPPSFCMLLRKHLSGGKLTAVTPVQGERIVFFDFACINEMGDNAQITLAAELMGRYSNLVLINKDTGKIIDALKRVDFDDSQIRPMLPGLKYVLPPKPAAKLDFITTDTRKTVETACLLKLPVQDALIKTCGGIGPVVCREAAYRAFLGQDKAADELTPNEKQTLCEKIDEIKADFYNGNTAYAVKSPEGKPTEFSFTPLTQYFGAGFSQEKYQSFSSLLDSYYSEKDRAERMHQKSRELYKAVKNLHERTVRKQAARKEELIQSKNSENLRLFGELISANLWALEKGQSSITLKNYYTDEDVTIPLEVRLTPAANAQKYFKEYKKKQTAAVMLEKLLREGETEIKYLETVLDEISRAEGEAALFDIRAELKSGGYLKYYKAKDKKQKPADFIRYRSCDGFLILVGRNNVQNDRLTLKTARGKDLWFHTKNAPGSHTVVMSEGDDIPDATKNQAAQLAVYYSSQRGGSKVAVDYTEVRNIKKTSDLKPGMVIYDKYETAYITADTEALEKIEKVK